MESPQADKGYGSLGQANAMSHYTHGDSSPPPDVIEITDSRNGPVPRNPPETPPIGEQSYEPDFFEAKPS